MKDTYTEQLQKEGFSHLPILPLVSWAQKLSWRDHSLPFFQEWVLWIPVEKNKYSIQL